MFDRSEWARNAPREGAHFAAHLTPEQRLARRAERMRAARAADPEKFRARQNARYATPEQREVRNARQRAERQANPEKFRLRERKRALQRYGLTIESWDELFDSQGRRCKSCGTDDPGSAQRRWHTDHDHQTGRIRGILCNHCNVTLGQLGDDSEGVKRHCRELLAYLEGCV